MKLLKISWLGLMVTIVKVAQFFKGNSLVKLVQNLTIWA